MEMNESKAEVRIYKLCQLDPCVIHYDHPYTYLVVQVQVGKQEAHTHAVKATSESVCFNEEICLRLLWPTVARKVIFRLLDKNGSEALAEAVLSLKQCQGDDECSPLFGPAFVNFHRIEEPDEPSPAVRFVGRALVEFDCAEEDRVRDHCSIPDEEAKYADYIQGRCEYVLLCSFSDANYIHPMFRKKNISFNVSLGPFGNTAYKTAVSAHRTISVTPAYSGIKYYGIAWGNQKPICEIQCAWENIERRIGRCNAVQHVANVIDTLVNMAVRETNGCGAVASHICDALHRSLFLLGFIIESMLMYTSWLVRLDRRARERLSFAANTRLDSARMMRIKSKACETRATFRRLRFRFGGTRSIIEVALDRLRDAAHLLNLLALDSQMSIPHVLVTMNSGSESLAYAKVPITEIFYSGDKNLKGTYCGYTRAVAMEQIRIKASEKEVRLLCLIPLHVLELEKFLPGHFEQLYRICGLTHRTCSSKIALMNVSTQVEVLQLRFIHQIIVICRNFHKASDECFHAS
uniref:C2 domain-containing protein n=1 Tax=Parascaris univalens TaxID=6257 RepID=A0A915A0F0_PARUN